jgi:hypothetical protein
MAPEAQFTSVIEKLKELNPGFPGKASRKIEGGQVTELSFEALNVTDISPVAALPALRSLGMNGVYDAEKEDYTRVALADLSPLENMSTLRELGVTFTSVSDLRPIGKLKLTTLYVWGTFVKDLSPLQGMPLEQLHCTQTDVSDVSPLAGMPLAFLNLGWTQVSDLRPLAKCPLEWLKLDGSNVTDLSPLRGIKLLALFCRTKGITDHAPLAGLPLKRLVCNFVPERDTEILRSITTLEQINTIPAAEFWNKHDARPWRIIADGKSMDPFREKNGWRIEDGALVKLSVGGSAQQTWEEFEDGEVRIRFQCTGVPNLYFAVRQGSGTGMTWGLQTLPPPEMEGRVNELVFMCHDRDVTARLNGNPVAVGGATRVTRGCLQIYASGPVFRVLSIEHRDLPPHLARPWSRVFNGRTLEGLHHDGNWRVEGSALKVSQAQDASIFTREEFGDGEFRVRFETSRLTDLSLAVRKADGGGRHKVVLRGDAVKALDGAPHELVVRCQGNEMTAELDGKPQPFDQRSGARRGRLMISVWGEGLLIHSLDFRELK